MILPGNPRQKVMVPCPLEKLDVLGGVMFLVGQDGKVFPVGRRSRQRILSPAACGLSIGDACPLCFQNLTPNLLKEGTWLMSFVLYPKFSACWPLVVLRPSHTWLWVLAPKSRGRSRVCWEAGCEASLGATSENRSV